MNDNQIRDINLTRKEINELNENLSKKVKNDLSNKYYNLIRDKRYDINAFDKEIQKEVIKFKFHLNPFYNNIFAIIEKKFLEEITKYLDYYYRGLFYPKFIERIMDRKEENKYENKYETYQFDKSICFDIGKVSIRNIIENENFLKPVDKYKNKQPKPKDKGKTEKMSEYNKTIPLPLPKKSKKEY